MTTLENIELPKVPKQSGHYLSIKQIGNIVYVSGITSKWNGEISYKGKIGKDVTIEEGYEAAKTCALNLLAVLEDYLGDLSQINQIVKVTGYVNCSEDFGDIPKVINGASDLFVKLFGKPGEHVRCAVGAASLPGNAAVEVDVIAEIN